MVYLSDGFPFECLAFTESFAFQEFNLFLLTSVIRLGFADLVLDFKDLLLASFNLVVLELSKLGVQAGAQISARRKTSLCVSESLEWDARRV